MMEDPVKEPREEESVRPLGFQFVLKVACEHLLVLFFLMLFNDLHVDILLNIAITPQDGDILSLDGVSDQTIGPI